MNSPSVFEVAWRRIHRLPKVNAFVLCHVKKSNAVWSSQPRRRRQERSTGDHCWCFCPASPPLLLPVGLDVSDLKILVPPRFVQDLAFALMLSAVCSSRMPIALNGMRRPIILRSFNKTYGTMGSCGQSTFAPTISFSRRSTHLHNTS